MSTLFNLQSGRVVRIGWGSGLVPIAETTEDTVAFVARNYAITATGILLIETDYHNVTRRGIAPAGFPISAKARRLQEALLLPFEAPYVPIDER